MNNSNGALMEVYETLSSARPQSDVYRSDGGVFSSVVYGSFTGHILLMVSRDQGATWVEFCRFEEPESFVHTPDGAPWHRFEIGSDFDGEDVFVAVGLKNHVAL